MKNIYHYCTVESLKQILKNKTLRLSDIRKSNDSKELDFLFDSYCEYLLKTDDYSDSAKLKVNALKYDKKIQFENTVFLVSCFSKKPDDLHMWSCYGNKGVNIEFDKKALKKHLNRIRVGVPHETRKEWPSITSGTPVLEMAEVEYKNEKTISEYFKKNFSNDSEDFFQLFKNSPKIKSDFFACEKEIRVIYCYISSPDSDKTNFLSYTDDFGNIKGQIPFDSTCNGEYQHKMVLDIPIPVGLIKSITIGPNSTATKEDIGELLYINGIDKYSIEIKKSKGSYR